MRNEVILQKTAMIYVRWSNSTSKRKRNFKAYRKSNKELNILIEKKFQDFVKNKKKRERGKELQHFQEMQISFNEMSRAW